MGKKRGEEDKYTGGQGRGVGGKRVVVSGRPILMLLEGREREYKGTKEGVAGSPVVSGSLFGALCHLFSKQSSGQRQHLVALESVGKVLVT